MNNDEFTIEFLEKQIEKYMYKKVLYCGVEYEVTRVFWSFEDEKLVFYIENSHPEGFERVYGDEVLFIN